MLKKFQNLEWAKVIKGAFIAGAGAALAFLSEWASGTDFGAMSPVVTAILSVGVNFLRKLKNAKGDDNG